jgi:hypothetical protein
MQEIGRANRFVMVEAWSDAAVRDAHAKATASAQFVEDLKAVQNAPPDVRLENALYVAPAKVEVPSSAVFVVTHVDVVPPGKDDCMALLKAMSIATPNDPGNGLFLRLERLVAVRQHGRPLDRDEGMIEQMVTAVAAGAELVKRRNKGRAVLVVDRFLQRLERRADFLVDSTAAEQVVHVFKPFLQFADLIICKRPVTGTAGEPQLDMTQLLQGHDLAKPGGGGRCRVGRWRRCLLSARRIRRRYCKKRRHTDCESSLHRVSPALHALPLP